MIIAKAGRVMMTGDFVDNISETLSVIDSLRIALNRLEGPEEVKNTLIKEVSDDIVDTFFLGINEAAHRNEEKDGDKHGSEDDNAEGQE